MSTNYTFVLLTLALLFSACNADKSAATEAEKMEAPAPPPTTPEAIIMGQLLSIPAGIPISNIDMSLEKGLLQSGEGEFEVYYIKTDTGKEVGYIVAEPEDAPLVSNIFITDSGLVLPNGLHVGSTWAEVKDAAGSVEVHGSEIEARTYADLGDYQLRLEYMSTSYDINESSIPNDTKVTEIWLRK